MLDVKLKEIAAQENIQYSYSSGFTYSVIYTENGNLVVATRIHNT